MKQASAVSATQRNPVPAADADRLIELRLAELARGGADVRTELDLLCAQLVARGYTLQAVAAVLDVTREMVRLRVKRVPAEQVAHIEPAVSKQIVRLPKPVKPRLTAQELAELVELRPLARQRRGVTSRDPLVAAASAEFNRILMGARERGVTAYSMAADLGVTPAAVTLRIKRLEGRLPPSMRPSAPKERAEPLLGSEQELARLRELASLARSHRPGAHQDSEEAEASAEFNRLLVELVDRRGVPVNALARALDRRHSGLLERLSKARAVGVEQGGSNNGAGGPVIAEADPGSDDSDDGDLSRVEGDVGAGGEGSPEADGDSSVDAAGQQPVPRGWLTDFVESTVPSAPAQPAPAALVDPTARVERTAEHHAAVARLRLAAAAAGRTTKVWDVGQDAAFVVAGRLVNVELKTVGGPDSAGQYRLGIGQLQEQVEQHLTNAELGVAWYAAASLDAVVPVLVVETAEPVPALWQRLAQRLQMLVLGTQHAEQLFGSAELDWLPHGVPLPGPQFH